MPELPANSVLVRACHQVGFDASGALPLRRHATDVYLLPHAGHQGVVVKIVPATAYTSAHRSVALTRWLQTQGFPCTTTEDVEQPVQVDDQCVTFWRYFDQHGRAAPGAGTLGRLLRELHRLPAPPIELPDAAPLAEFPDWVAADPRLPDDDRAWLLEERRRLLADYDALQFPLGVGFIHGDAYPGNTVWGDDDHVLLGDWDEPAIGPRELDLANTLQGGIRFGRSPAELGAFIAAYGRDLRAWRGMSTLIALRDLHTLGSFLRRAGRGNRRAAQELTTRVDSLRDGDLEAWKPA